MTAKTFKLTFPSAGKKEGYGVLTSTLVLAPWRSSPPDVAGFFPQALAAIMVKKTLLGS